MQRLLIILAIAVIGCSHSWQSMASDLPTAAELISLWKSRTQTAEKIVIEWDETESSHASRLFGKDLRLQDNSGKPFAKGMVETVKHCRLVSDGERWKSTEQGSIWDNTLERFLPKTRVWVHDRETYKCLDKKDVPPDEGYDIGFIHAASKGDHLTTAPDMAPYFLLVNPFHPRLGQLSASRLRLLDEHDMEGTQNHHCCVLSFQNLSEPYKIRVWLAHDLDWLPVKLEVGNRVEIEFRYDSVAPQSLIQPSGWTITIRSPDLSKVDSSTVATVTRWEERSELPDSEFHLHFPTGTVVWDYLHKVDDVPKNYLVKPDGTFRPISMEERLKEISYSKLLSTEPNEAIPLPPSAIWRMLYTVIGVIVVAIIAAIGMRRHMSPR